jgi:hypothetical protein
VAHIRRILSRKGKEKAQKPSLIIAIQVEGIETSHFATGLGKAERSAHGSQSTQQSQQTMEQSQQTTEQSQRSQQSFQTSQIDPQLLASSGFTSTPLGPPAQRKETTTQRKQREKEVKLAIN